MTSLAVIALALVAGIGTLAWYAMSPAPPPAGPYRASAAALREELVRRHATPALEVPMKKHHHVRREHNGAFRRFVREQILAAEAQGFKGEEAFGKVVDAAIKFLDALIAPPSPIAEGATDLGLMAARGLVGMLVQHAYDDLKAERP